jgi:hypothetical protein
LFDTKRSKAAAVSLRGHGTKIPLLRSVGGVGQRIQKDKASISRGLLDARVCQAIGADLAPASSHNLMSMCASHNDYWDRDQR